MDESLSIENTLWSDTVVASGTAVGVVVYTGKHTRSVMNASNPQTKVGLKLVWVFSDLTLASMLDFVHSLIRYLLCVQIGLLDEEINRLTKILFVAVIVLSFALIIVKVNC